MKIFCAFFLVLIAGLAGAAAVDDGAQESGKKSAKVWPKLESVLVQADQERGAVNLDAVAATGSRLNIPTRDLPASIAMVPQELIQLRGARTINEALYAAVGMSGGMSSGSIPNFSTRGFTGNDITVMRDGIRQNTASQSSRPLDSFLLQRVEVLKGPASLLYGEGAVGAAINYVSKLPSDTFSGEADIGAGSWDSYRVGIGAGGPTAIDNVFFRADISSNRSGGYVDGSESKYDGYAAALRWDATPQTSLTLSGNYLNDKTNSYYGTPVVYDAVIDQNGVHSVSKANAATDELVGAHIVAATRRLNYNNLDNFARAENSFWRLIAASDLADDWSLHNETYIATQHLNWRNTESTVWNPLTQLVDRSSFFLIYRNDFQIGDRVDVTWSSTVAGLPNKLVLGALYDSNKQIRNSGQTYPAGSPTPASVTLTDFERGYGPDVDYQKTARIITDTKAVYFEDILEPIADLKVVSGLRYDAIDVERVSYLELPRYTKTYEPVTGRLGLIYALTPVLNVYASYSRAAQPVSQLVSLTAAQDDFSLQKGRQYEIGSKVSFFDGRADFTLALFDIEKTDLLTSDVVNGVRINSQIGAQVSQGAEAALALALPDGWHIDTNLAWTWRAEFKDFYENLGIGVISRNGNTPPNVPKVVAGIFIAKDIDAWRVTTGVRYVGEMQANNNSSIQLDAYTTVDASIGYRWENVTATLWGRNLTDKTYAEWAAGSGLMQRLADPRSVEVALKYAF